MLTLPNLPHPSVPEGRTPEENVTYSTHGDPAAAGPHAVAHWDIPGFAKLFDFERGAKVTGAGFPFFIGEGARLVRALDGRSVPSSVRWAAVGPGTIAKINRCDLSRQQRGSCRTRRARCTRRRPTASTPCRRPRCR